MLFERTGNNRGVLGVLTDFFFLVIDMNAFSEGVQEGATNQEYPASVGQGKPSMSLDWGCDSLDLVRRTSEQTIQNPFLRSMSF